MGGGTSTGTVSTANINPPMAPLTEVPDGVNPNLIGTYQGISLVSEQPSLTMNWLGLAFSGVALVISLLAGILSQKPEYIVLAGLSSGVLIFSMGERFHYFDLRLRTKCKAWEARYWLFNSELRANCVKPRTKAEVHYVISEAVARDKVASHPEAIDEIYKLYWKNYWQYEMDGRIPTIEQFEAFLQSLEPPKEEPT